MPEELEPIERMQLALRGAEVDRAPISFWGPDLQHEWSAEGLAEGTLEFQARHGWDFVNLNPRATSYAEDWGSRYRPSEEVQRGPLLLEPAVSNPDRFGDLRLLDPTQGAYGQQLRALRLVVRELGGRVPIVQTVFTPLSVARYLVPDNDPAHLVRWMEEAPEAVQAGLEAITTTLCRYVEACLEAGAAGIFFATTVWASRDRLPPERYKSFAAPYDRRVLEAANGAWLNILHICQSNIYFDPFRGYPNVHAVHWGSREPGNPSLGEGLKRTNHAVMGGIDHRGALVTGPVEEVVKQVQEALEETGGRRVMLAPGCTIPPRTPPAHLQAARQAVLAWYAAVEE